MLIVGCFASLLTPSPYITGETATFILRLHLTDADRGQARWSDTLREAAQLVGAVGVCLPESQCSSSCSLSLPKYLILVPQIQNNLHSSLLYSFQHPYLYFFILPVPQLQPLSSVFSPRATLPFGVQLRSAVDSLTLWFLWEPGRQLG